MWQCATVSSTASSSLGAFLCVCAECAQTSVCACVFLRLGSGVCSDSTESFCVPAVESVSSWERGEVMKRSTQTN